jgi:hypothetical protein
MGGSLYPGKQAVAFPAKPVRAFIGGNKSAIVNRQLLTPV